MTMFSCFVHADIPPADTPAIPEHFTKFVKAPDATSAKGAVKAWCAKIGFQVHSVMVWPAGDLERGQYDDPAKVIAASQEV
jgi:hypothetical protein